MKVLIILPYFGETPAWLDYFLKSCSYNPGINWLLYSNIKLERRPYRNILIENASIEDFNRLASSKLGISIRISHPYKICDFRPAFGVIFKDYIKNYGFWGYCDLDLIFGKISDFINRDHLKIYDVITSKPNYISGHFTLYRNCSFTQSLYKKIWNIYRILRQDNRHYAIDELSNRIGKNIIDSGKKLDPLRYFLRKSKNSLRFRFLKIMPLQFDQTK